MTLNCKVIFCGSHEVVRCIICVVLVFLEKISEKKNVTGILSWMCGLYCTIVAPHKRNWHVIHLMLMSQAMSKHSFLFLSKLLNVPHQCGVRRYWEMTERRVRSTFENTRDDTLQLCACSPSLDYMYIQGVRSRFLFSEQTSKSSHAHSFWEECKKGKGILLNLREGLSYMISILGLWSSFLPLN